MSEGSNGECEALILGQQLLNLCFELIHSRRLPLFSEAHLLKPVGRRKELHRGLHLSDLFTQRSRRLIYMPTPRAGTSA